MATDNRSSIAGVFKYGFTIPCILCEGAVTVADAFSPTGLKQDDMITFGAEIEKGDIVYLTPGTKNLYEETEGMPVMTKMDASTRYAGIVVTDPKPAWSTPPASTLAFTDCDNANWAAILAAKAFRVASVAFFFTDAVFEVDVLCDGSNEVAVAAPGDLKYDVSEEKFIPVDSGGAGFVPLHYVPAGSSGDQYTILVAALTAGIVGTA